MTKNKTNPRLQKLKRWLLLALLIFIAGSIIIVILLRFVPIPTSAFMLQKHIEDVQLDKGFIQIQQQWQSVDSLSPHIFHAVIAAEDQLFYQHIGFDFKSIWSAVTTRTSGGKLRGASTISQQVAKNLFLTPSRSFWRKGFEVWFTLLIEIFWSKERILLVYVNIAEFGDHIYGAEAASQHFFNIPAKNLSHYQAALLAGSLPNPAIFKVDDPNQKLREKQTWILRQMKNLDYI